MRTSRPTFPIRREVRDAWFRFAAGESSSIAPGWGRMSLEQFFTIDGAAAGRGRWSCRLARSSRRPCSSEILFGKMRHCAGEAYPECIQGGGAMSRELAAAGHNFSDTRRLRRSARPCR